MTLMRLRRNVTFGELGEDFGVAASTAWGYFQRITDMLAMLLAVDIEELAESVRDTICLVDGTLVQVFNWRDGATARISGLTMLGLIIGVAAAPLITTRGRTRR